MTMKPLPSLQRTTVTVVWILLAVGILHLDYRTGPNIATSYLFLFPVALAAHYNGRTWGWALAVGMPLIRFCFHFAWDDSISVTERVLNAVIRISVLTIAAYLVDRVRRQAQEIKILRGILPICMTCKKIRTPDQKWLPVEAYITKNSEAKFSHTFCPECGEKFYGAEWEEAAPEKPAKPPLTSDQPSQNL
jgi:hypothetical protein